MQKSLDDKCTLKKRSSEMQQLGNTMILLPTNLTRKVAWRSGAIQKSRNDYLKIQWLYVAWWGDRQVPAYGRFRKHEMVW